MEKRIYSKKMAQYLTEQGFRYNKIVQDTFKPQFSNWIFEESEELDKKIQEFLEINGKKKDDKMMG